ncbi:MAG: phytanoyl-CoA dioxygenase family protein [Opitutaceae bacterium]|nr:phytanoyl-CoA dioxygenase family protein [Opitutaceae bacterium]
MTPTPEQIAQFRRRGFLAVPHFFNADETAALQADIARLKRNSYLRNVATEGDGQTHSNTKQNLQLCPANFYSTLIRALPFAPKVLDAVTRLIGPEITLHLDQIFLKPGKTGMGTAWHQDNAYFKIPAPLRGTAMWIAVHDATVANGTMRVIPEAWADALPHARDGNSDHHIRCHPDESKAETIELQAGGVLFFCYGTPHATGDNTTATERAGLAFHFLCEDQTSDDFYTTGRIGNPRPRLTGPRATGGFEEYGATIAGTWDAEVAQANRAYLKPPR